MFTFLFIVISNLNLHDMPQRFLCSQKQNFSWIRQETKNFRTYFFYYLIFLTETYMICLNVFYVVRNEISAGFDNRLKNFPIYPHFKNSSLWQRHAYRFLQWGVYGETLYLLSDPIEILFLTT